MKPVSLEEIISGLEQYNRVIPVIEYKGPVKCLRIAEACLDLAVKGAKVNKRRLLSFLIEFSLS